MRRRLLRPSLAFAEGGGSSSTVITENPSTTVAEGVMVDAAPPWVGSLVMANGETATAETGVDLTTVDEIKIHFTRNNTADGEDTWPCPVHIVKVEDIELEKTQGALLTHFDNQFLGIENMTQAMLEAGDIQFNARSNNSSFGYEVHEIEFRKRIAGTSQAIDGVNVVDEGNGFVRMWGNASGVNSVTLPVEVADIADCEVHVTTRSLNIDRHIQPNIAASNGTTLVLTRISSTQAQFGWSVYGRKA